MKCSRVALFLALVLTSAAARLLADQGATAAGDGTAMFDEQIAALALPWAEVFEQAIPFEPDGANSDDSETPALQDTPSETPVTQDDTGATPATQDDTGAMPAPRKYAGRMAAMGEDAGETPAPQEDEPAADDSSPYDMFYVDALYWGYFDENSPDDGEQVASDDESGAKKVDADEEVAIDATLARGFQAYLSWLTESGKSAVGFAAYCWEQAVTYVRENSPNREEVAMAPDRRNHDNAAETDDETSPAPVESQRAAVDEAPRPKLVECLYVTWYPKYDNAAFLANAGRLNVERPLGQMCQRSLFVESYWVDPQACPSLEPNASLALLQAPVAEAEESVTDDVPPAAAFAEAEESVTDDVPPAAPSLPTRLTQWAKWSLGQWNGAFRNISQQIARLDWTLLLDGRFADRAVRNTASASDPIER